METLQRSPAKRTSRIEIKTWSAVLKRRKRKYDTWSPVLSSWSQRLGILFQIQLDIDAKSIKNKWETGTVRNVNLEQADRSQELEELKKNVPVKERYKTRSVDETPPERRPVPEVEQLDTSCKLSETA